MAVERALKFIPCGSKEDALRLREEVRQVIVKAGLQNRYGVWPSPVLRGRVWHVRVRDYRPDLPPPLSVLTLQGAQHLPAGRVFEEMLLRASQPRE